MKILYNNFRELKAKASICRVLRQRHEKALNESALLPDGPDFGEVLESPKIMRKFWIHLCRNGYFYRNNLIIKKKFQHQQNFNYR